jgi:hypothetical protein
VCVCERGRERERDRKGQRKGGLHLLFKESKSLSGAPWFQDIVETGERLTGNGEEYERVGEKGRRSAGNEEREWMERDDLSEMQMVLCSIDCILV